MAETIRISVKGSVTDGQMALVAHGVRGVLVSEGKHSTFWDVPESARHAVVSWFCNKTMAGPGCGFPPGTLLHHS